MKKKMLVAAVIVFGLAAAAMVATNRGWLTSLILGEERAVRNRAQAYWEARLAGDFKAMAPYIHPLQKAVQNNDLLETRSYEITGITVGENETEAVVAVKAKYRVKLARTTSADRELEHTDRWVRYKGVWYHDLHPVGFGEVLQHGLGKWKPPTKPEAAPTKPAAAPTASVAPETSSTPPLEGAAR